ncbi:MAG: DEAD/DEAH box helicase [Deltaproteobacteria bacterium]|nr:DEAD/DEAH box helicase [Deltaproteobacteria bacterium]MBW2640090.1 DEAD/DEAH box helicase [Deltaproteobacteria bacterium]
MINLKDKLSHLTFRQACKLLGPQGDRLIRSGGKYDIDIYEQVVLQRDLFQLNLGEARVSIRLDSAKDQRFDIQCSQCSNFCEHMGAAFSLILEEKLSLGLSAPPPERVPMESLSEKELVQRAFEERAERAQKEKMRLKSMDKDVLWTDYIVTNNSSGKCYRVALRGWERGESFCSCPDYRKNTLGTCKHILYALDKVGKRFNKSVKKTSCRIKDICVYLNYGETQELRLLIPEGLDSQIQKLLKPFREKSIEDVRDLIDRIGKIENLGFPVTIYPDAEEYINEVLYRERVKNKVKEIRNDPKNHPFRKTLLKTELLPYQLDGIAFAVGAGRAVIADDMGLGKTVQGIGVAELLSQDANISKVLVICPASLKSQWRLEIKRFSNLSCQLVIGSAKERADQYDSSCFFTVCNYEQVLRDVLSIEKVKWDLIILDEGQRIKNWEAKTSRIVKALKSPFALVLSGTPLENRLDDLYSVVEFIDDRRLGPAFRFFNTYRVIDERGKLLGYKNLDALRKKLKPVLLRRTRKMVLKELPPRTTEIMRIPPTDEQLEIHNGHKRIVQTIITKKYLTEMDILRLQKALLMCRMAANSTFLVDKQPPGFSTKLGELDDLLGQLIAEEDRKIILFSEWTTMLNLIEPILEMRQLKYVRLDGSVPQKKRQGLMHQFQKDPRCKLFVTTNAGSTGLNLQAANTVINVDLPWNPAVLEQRISRVHRMGQKRPVQVFIMVTEDTLEESLLGTLAAKHELALAVLDPDAQTADVDLSSGMEELKRRLEVLLGTKPDAPPDESLRMQVEKETEILVRKERVANAGGQLIGAAFAFIGEMFAGTDASDQTIQMAETFKKRLSEGLEKGEDGKLTMKISFPDEGALDNLAKSLARMVSLGN